MKTLVYSYQLSSIVPQNDLQPLANTLTAEIERIRTAWQANNYQSPYGSICLSADTALRDTIKDAVANKKKLNPSILIVIGIGGSNLGTLAIQQALYGTLYNDQHPDIKIYFADTVDTDYIYDIVLRVEQALEAGDTVLLNIISKSGSTLETVANFELFYELLKKAYGHNCTQYMVITTDENSPLWQFAHAQKITCLPIPALVGGRYSVLSAVSLFPLAMLGVDIDELHRGAHDIMPRITSSQLSDNPSAHSALLLAWYNNRGYAIHNSFLFSVDLQAVGAWYRQLMAESIGKKNDRHGNTVHAGMVPITSIGSTDLHSIGQLYLGGPDIFFTTFICVDENKSNLTLTECSAFQSLRPDSQKKPLAHIMSAILNGVQTAYLQDKRPFVTITLPEKSAYYIGQLLQLKMVEIMYLGFLLTVNPFDQPQVELYKKETQKYL